MYSAMGYRGLEIIRTGKLRQLREELKLTPNHMAMLMYVSAVTYKIWESWSAVGTVGRMWNTAAEKVARFYDLAFIQLEEARMAGFQLDEMVPIHMAASLLGMPQDLLARAVRNDAVEAMDLGLLGTWVYRDELKRVDEEGLP